MKVEVLKNGYTPERAHFDDAGMDFKTYEKFTLAPFDSRVVEFDVAVQIPIGYFGKMESKSGLMVNHAIICMGGIIDSGFRGTIKVRIINLGSEPYTFQVGDKVAQMILIPCGLFDVEPVEKLDPSQSGRDKSGWGSTGR